jgi:protein-S-isoprenylcysteine O-methyltransferase Ste14
LYVFLDVALLGVVIALRQPWLVGPWLALVAIHAWAARREARVLERAFGDAYRQYRAKTWW